MRAVYPLLACLGLVVAFPRPQGTAPDPNDPELLDITAYEQAFDKEVQDKILKPCSDKLVSSTDQDPKKIWRGLGCGDLNHLLSYNFTMASQNDDTKLDYVEFMSNRMHGPPNRRCRDFDNRPCEDADLQCHQTFFSCGHMILNSFANIFNMHKSGYDYLEKAHDRIQDDIPSFAENFCPDIDNSVMKDIIPVVFSLATFGAGALAERLIKPLTSIKNFPLVKDGMMLSTGMGTPLALNHVDDNMDGNIDSKISALLGVVYDAFIEAQREQIDNLFSGSAESQEALRYMLDDGAFIRYEPVHNWEDLKDDIYKMFYGALIPKAWEMTPKFQNSESHRYSKPLFIKSDDRCGEAGKRHGATEICYKDEAWYMVVAHLHNGSPSQGPRTRPDWSWEFQKLPGEKYLVSDEGYFGLKAEDMLASAIEGYEKGDSKQYWSPDTEDIVKGDSAAEKELNLPGGVREPGFVQMLICPSWDEAVDRMKDAIDPKDLDLTKLLDNKHWPCPE